MRILVVEDDVDLSEMLRISLSQEGCIAEKAGSGEEGEFLEHTPVDQILPQPNRIISFQ